VSHPFTVSPTLGGRHGAGWATAFIAAEFGAIDEHQAAVIEGDCPPSTRIGNVLAADIDAIASVLAEIVDNDSRAFVAGAGVDTHPAAHRKLGRRGRVGLPIGIFVTSVIHERSLPQINVHDERSIQQEC
jgi:hypothetical protein